MVLDILEYPDSRLRKIASPVAAVTADIRKLVADMAETMYTAPGVGLAATQVNVHKRVLVIDVSEARNDLWVFINPEIVAAEGEAECEEGCLSVPGYYDKVIRAAEITVRAQNEHGKMFELSIDGMLAVCIQHELDHLEGKLFVDYLSQMKRERIRKKLEKERKERAAAAPAGAGRARRTY